MIVGIDGARLSGLAVIEPQGTARPLLPTLSSVRVSRRGDEVPPIPGVALALVTMVLSHGALAAEEISRVGIERAPFYARGDVSHGSQAEIGWKQGYLAGLIHGMLWPAAGQPDRVRLVEVSDWRARMLVWSTRWGVLACGPGRTPEPSKVRVQPRTVERDGAGFRLRFKPCGHLSASPMSYSELVDNAPDHCPECARHVSVPTGRTADERRDAWKRLACELTRRNWPEPYEALVKDARSRAKIESQPDHKLVGVPDACEAAWIACSLLEG